MKRALIRCTLFWALLALMLEFLYAFIPDQTLTARLFLHELKQRPGHIDTAFLGTSHVYSGVNPEVVKKRLGGYVIDMGSADQTAIDCYYLLCETLKDHTIGTLVLEVGGRGYAMEEPMFGNTQRIIGSFPLSPNKLSYHRDALGYPVALDGLYRVALRHDDVIRGVKNLALLDKFRPEYLVPKVDEHAQENYMGRGYVRSNRVLDRNVDIDQDIGVEEQFSDKQIGFLERIAALCQEQGIRLVLTTLPVHPSHLILKPEYQPAHDWFAGFASKNGLPYLDYNLLSESELPLGDDCFRDWTHLNGIGSDKFSARLADDLAGIEAGQTPDGFCTDYQERIREIKGVVGLELKVRLEDNQAVLSGRMLTGDANLTAECRFELHRRDDGELLWAREYGADEARLDVKPGRYTLVGYARTAGSGREYDATQRLEFTIY